MSGECFHYADFIAHEVGDETDFPGGEAQPTKSHRNIDQSSFTIKRLPRLVDQFRSTVRCPYCRTTLETNESSSGHYWGKRTYDLLLFGGRCQHCNWWYIQENYDLDDDAGDKVIHSLSTYEGVICRFEQVFWVDAITKAENELIEYRRGLKKLQPRDVEIVVGKILSQYHQCDVHHVGRSHDNGIDLIVIKGDADIAVQVKHHYQSDRVEGVRPVREFVGALVGETYSEGIFVSTAISFSKDAQAYSSRVNRNFVPLNLIDVRGLRELIGNITRQQWEAYDELWNRRLKS